MGLRSGMVFIPVELRRMAGDCQQAIAGTQARSLGLIAITAVTPCNCYKLCHPDSLSEHCCGFCGLGNLASCAAIDVCNMGARPHSGALGMVLNAQVRQNAPVVVSNYLLLLLS
ncbi:MAG: hypothetical protein ACI80M_000142 [Gammaproteobacteria bacterium]|jgi:hypothetical protein